MGDTVNKRRARKSWAMAFCGLAVAVCVVLQLAGAVLPIAMFIAPAAAGFVVAAVCAECGRRAALAAYAAAGILGLALTPDKEIPLIFIVLLGYYPLVKPAFDRIRPRWLRLPAKLGLCNAAVLAMYGVLLALFAPAAGMGQAGLALAAATLAIGNVAFALYDKALANLLRVYLLVWRPRLYRMTGR